MVFPNVFRGDQYTNFFLMGQLTGVTIHTIMALQNQEANPYALSLLAC
jgi:hypothetical protein